MDLSEWWADRRWVELLDLIMQLPTACRLTEAKLNHPVYAYAIAEREREATLNHEKREEWSPPFHEYDLHAVLLREIREAVIAVRSGLFETTYLPTADGKHQKSLKPPHTPVLPAPVTEVDRIKARLSRQAQLEIIALFAPHAVEGLTEG